MSAMNDLERLNSAIKELIEKSNESSKDSHAFAVLSTLASQFNIRSEPKRAFDSARLQEFLKSLRSDVDVQSSDE